MSEKVDEFNRIFTYHAPNETQIRKYESIREKAREFAELLDSFCPASREKSLAFTKIEEAVMWANASIARRDLI